VSEICDGKDNDCDGVVDNDARCALGFVCVGGECVQTCEVSGEFYRPCPADRVCKQGACVVKPCALVPCAAGQVCRPSDGVCVDPCAGMVCLPGAECKNGTCVDCYTTGCPSGQRCIARRCTVDPCDGKACGEGQFCRAGACEAECAGVACGEGQLCAHGQCVSSPCPMICASDFFCDAKTGTCRPKPCSSIACVAGQTCVNTTGLCVDDPCEPVHCGAGRTCVVKDDGSPDCSLPAVSAVGRGASTSGSGAFTCSCRVGDGHPRGTVLRWACGLALAFLLGARRRWRR
jgi:hypothetical protein